MPAWSIISCHGKASGGDVSQAGQHVHEWQAPVDGVPAFSPGSKRHRLRDLACHAVGIAFGDGVDAANVVFVGVTERAAAAVQVQILNGHTADVAFEQPGAIGFGDELHIAQIQGGTAGAF